MHTALSCVKSELLLIFLTDKDEKNVLVISMAINQVPEAMLISFREDALSGTAAEIQVIIHLNLWQSTVLCHDPSGFCSGQAVDLMEFATYIL
jgi:hypothetical protein